MKTTNIYNEDINNAYGVGYWENNDDMVHGEFGFEKWNEQQNKWIPLNGNMEKDRIYIYAEKWYDSGWEFVDYELKIWINDDCCYYQTKIKSNLKSIFKKAIKKICAELKKSNQKISKRKYSTYEIINKWLQDEQRKWNDKQMQKKRKNYFTIDQFIQTLKSTNY